jgi:lysyl-tRNA synthetase class 2
MSEADLWRPAAPLEILRARARLLHRVRAWFDGSGAMEVETPLCCACGVTDPAIESFRVAPGALHRAARYLHSSPEFPMKRLLAAGSGPIYQICHVFRDGEFGRRHNPEFTLLEWYRPGWDLRRLMDEVADLVRAVSDRSLPAHYLSYGELFREYAGIDPHRAQAGQLRERALDLGLTQVAGLQLPDRDAWLDLLLTHHVEPRLPVDRMTFVYDYPASQAALARVRPGPPAVAERFELYLGGMELANGFHELTDAAEQRARFQAEQGQRRALGLHPVPMDEYLLAALEAGLPDCSGVALGVDRLLMWLSGVAHIAEVLPFPFDRA